MSTIIHISAVINTKNAGKTLQTTLNSLKWVDEIVVVDMQSTDNTQDIAKAYASDIYIVPDRGYVEPARNTALEKAQGNWIFLIDADEEVGDELAKHLANIAHSNEGSSITNTCYAIPRLNYIFGKAMQASGWWPDYQIRFFQKGEVTWKDEIHSQPQVKGDITYLPAKPEFAIIHHNYSSVSEFLQKMDRYTTITAHQDTDKSSPATQPTPLITFHNQFFSRFFAQQGYTDYIHGQALSILQAMYEVILELKKWEHDGFTQSSKHKTQHKHIQQVYAEYTYWMSQYMVEHSSGFSRLWWQMKRKLKW